MFKKNFKVSSKNQLSGKDKKQLKNHILTLMSPPSVQHFFSNNSKLIAEKVGQLKISIFVSDEEDPVLVHFNKQNTYLPTLYLANQYPNIIPAIWLKEGVEQFVFKGANVMCPGVEKFQNVQKNKIVGVRNSKGIFVAIGYMGQNGNEGIACEVVHYLGDKLWQHGSKMRSPVKFQQLNAKKEEQKLTPNNESISVQEQKKLEQGKQQQDQSSNIEKQIAQSAQKQGSQCSQPEQPIHLKDQYLQQALLNVIKLHKMSKEDFPMLTTTFFSKFIKVASPVPLDVTNSSYKRVSTFFEKMAQKGLIELSKWKEKSGNVWAVAAIDRTHQLVKQHKPTVEQVIKSEKQQLKLQKFKIVCNIKLQTSYQLTDPIEWLRDFDKPPKNLNKLYEERELDYLITKFLGQNKIKKYNKMVEQKQKNRTVKVKKQYIDIKYMDYPQLKEIISKEIGYHLSNFKLQQDLSQTIDEPQLKDTISVPLQTFRRNIFRFTVKSEQLTNQENAVIEVLGKKKFTSILVEAYKTHNKNVTTINNLQPFLSEQYKCIDQLQQLSHYFQLKFACGSVIRDISEQRQKYELYLQGNMFNEVMDFLTTEQGVDPSLITGINKLPKKKK